MNILMLADCAAQGVAILVGYIICFGILTLIAQLIYLHKEKTMTDAERNEIGVYLKQHLQCEEYLDDKLL